MYVWGGTRPQGEGGAFYMCKTNFSALTVKQKRSPKRIFDVEKSKARHRRRKRRNLYWKINISALKRKNETPNENKRGRNEKMQRRRGPQGEGDAFYIGKQTFRP